MDALNDQLDDAEDEEEKLKGNYDGVCAGKKSTLAETDSKEDSGAAAAAAGGNPYGLAAAAGARNEVSEDMF